MLKFIAATLISKQDGGGDDQAIINAGLVLSSDAPAQVVRFQRQRLNAAQRADQREEATLPRKGCVTVVSAEIPFSQGMCPSLKGQQHCSNGKSLPS